ncbi:hypothetical protein C1646_768955 [Rhizophagus diaphanus]|nr:hypothetical protein C1646_768955 [Rhizophagus diaphanus] [Rhizophagus sp. MUCL 43196]
MLKLISKWIDRLEITGKLTYSYEFRLLYRASCDGINFIEICDNQSHPIIIVKDNGEILGGYILSQVMDENNATNNSLLVVVI